jgi:uncharacterized delta-60 repeat protein
MFTVKAAHGNQAGSRVSWFISCYRSVIVAGATTTLTLAVAMALGSPASAEGWLDASFPDPDANGTLVSAGVIQPDGKILIGGNFEAVGGAARKRLARLNPNGTVDQSFQDPNIIAGEGGYVRQVIPQRDGKVLIVGAFSHVGGQSRPGLARLTGSGALDTSFVPPAFRGEVYRMATQDDGKILVYGNFNSVGGHPRDQIARLNSNGSLDSSFVPPTTDGLVEALVVQADGKVLVGGYFTTLGGVSRRRLARLHGDGSLDSSLVPSGVNGPVSDLVAMSDGRILVGGQFSTAYRLRTDGSLDTSFSSGMCTKSSDDPCFAAHRLFLQPDGKIFVTDDGTKARFARLNADGGIDKTFNPRNIGSVWWVAAQPDGKTIVGGQFTQIGGGARKDIARLVKSGSAPRAPTGVTVPWIDSTSMKVSWNQVDGDVSSYRVVATPGGQSCSTPRPGEDSCYVYGLEDGTTYTFKVTALNDFGPSPESQSSAPATAMRWSEPPPPPPRPTTLQVSTVLHVSRTKVTLISSATIVVSAAASSADDDDVDREPVSLTQIATTGKKKVAARCRAASTVGSNWVDTEDGDKQYGARLVCRLGSKGRRSLRKGSLKLSLSSTLTLGSGAKVGVQELIKLKRRR